MPLERVGELAALGTSVAFTITALAFESAGRRVGSLPVNILRLVFALAALTAFESLRGTLYPVAAPALWDVGSPGLPSRPATHPRASSAHSLTPGSCRLPAPSSLRRGLTPRDLAGMAPDAWRPACPSGAMWAQGQPRAAPRAPAALPQAPQQEGPTRPLPRGSDPDDVGPISPHLQLVGAMGTAELGAADRAPQRLLVGAVPFDASLSSRSVNGGRRGRHAHGVDAGPGPSRGHPAQAGACDAPRRGRCGARRGGHGGPAHLTGQWLSSDESGSTRSRAPTLGLGRQGLASSSILGFASRSKSSQRIRINSVWRPALNAMSTSSARRASA